MTLEALVAEYIATRAPGWLVLAVHEVQRCAVEAAQYYAGYGDIASISAGTAQGPALGSDPFLDFSAYTGATPAGEAAAAGVEAGTGVEPIRSLSAIGPSTVVSVGEWAVIRPLFWLYTERENSLRLEASRSAGLEVYGRSVSEISGDISMMETETLPAKAFVQTVVTVG